MAEYPTKPAVTLQDVRDEVRGVDEDVRSLKADIADLKTLIEKLRSELAALDERRDQ